MPEKVFDTYIISLYILKVALVKVNDLCTPHKTIRILYGGLLWQIRILL
jgi:hypothetical protein